LQAKTGILTKGREIFMEITGLGNIRISHETDCEEDRKLRKACQDFEAIFLHKLISQMRKTVPKSNLFGSRREEETWLDLADAELSTNISQAKSLGIGDLLYIQLSKGQKNR
jgi:Rod binding domain-containing protein